MRKFKTRRPRTLPFTPLLIVAGALLLTAALAPRANAAVIAYFNWEDAANGAAPDFTSEADQGLGVVTTIITNYNAADQATVPDFALGLNRLAADVDNPPNGLHSWGMESTGRNNGFHADIPLPSAQGIFQDMTITFAYNCAGNGFNLVTLFYSTDGGLTFTNSGVSATLLTAGTNSIATLVVPTAANNIPSLVLRLVFTGGTSNGNNPETQIDNLLIGGTIVPEPATVAGGLLGILGLCFHQRRRLIKAFRFQRT